MSVPWKAFEGKWNVAHAEHMEDFLGEVGVPWPVRKLGAKAASHYTIKVLDDNKVKIQMSSTFYTQPENEFHIDGPETQVDLGKKYTAKATWQDGKLVIQLSGSQDGKVKPHKVTRELVGEDELHQTMEIGNVVAKQHCKKASE